MDQSHLNVPAVYAPAEMIRETKTASIYPVTPVEIIWEVWKCLKSFAALHIEDGSNIRPTFENVVS